MDIVIPTCGRAYRQATLAQLHLAGLKPTLVVQSREFDEYKKAHGRTAHVVALPPHIKTIAPTRDWILNNIGNSNEICMVDDDLWFYRRRDDEPTRLMEISSEELNHAFHEVERYLQKEFAHVGFASREGANRNTDRYLTNTRILRVLGYCRDTLLDNSISFDMMECMEDFHVALSLLELGYPNLILNHYAHNQAGSGAEGGCSTWRTPEIQAKNAFRLKSLHPDYVTVVEKRTKTAWGGGTRTDVRIRWKQAYERSLPSF